MGWGKRSQPQLKIKFLKLGSDQARLRIIIAFASALLTHLPQPTAAPNS